MRAIRTLCAVGICAGWVLAAGPGFAQSSASGPPIDTETSPEISESVRAILKEGVKLAEAKNWQGAHAKFLEAFKQSDHYTIAANLGSMEIKMGRHREAAEHLAVYLRKVPADKVKDRMRALAFFEEAKKKVGSVQVRVNVNGAEILVDDRVAAISPPVDDVFVDPGPRLIKARRAGYKPAESAIEAAGGSVHQVTLTLEKLPEEKPAVKAPPPKETPKPAVAPPPETEGFKPKREIIYAGIAVTAAGVLSGTIFALVSSSQGSSADERMNALIAKAGPNACVNGGGQNATDCQTLHDLRVSRDNYGNVAAWSFILGALAGAGTAVYTFALPSILRNEPTKPSDSSPAPSAPPKAQAKIVPVAMPAGGGVFVTGSF